MDTEEFERLTPLVEAEAQARAQADPEGWAKAQQIADRILEEDEIDPDNGCPTGSLDPENV